MDWKTHIRSLLDAGASVNDLAERMGVSPNAVREIMAGRTKSPNADAALKLSKLKPRHFEARAAKKRKAA